MNSTLILGWITTFFNFLYIVLIPLSLIAYRRHKKLDLQLLILYTSIFMLTPVIVFENLLFVDLNYGMLGLSYNEDFMRLTFVLGTVGYLMFNLHLLTVEDMPSIPVSILSSLSGFAIGTVAISAQLDPTSTVAPITYDPIQGGVNFIVSLMVFNLIGAIGFLVYQIRKGKLTCSPENFVGIMLFLISPLVIYASRILSFTPIPFNGIFLLPSLTFSISLGSSIVGRFGYEVSYRILSMYVLDLTTDTVIGGYSKEHGQEELKVTGMAFLAIDSIIHEVSVERSFLPFQGATYGNVIISKHDNLMVVSTYLHGGRKLGKFLQNRFLRQLHKELESLDEMRIRELIERYLYLFIPEGVNKDDVFLTM